MKKQYNVQTSYAAAIPRGSRNGAGEGLRRTVVTSSSGGNVDLSSKLDASVFYDLFEKINIGSAESPLYAIRAKYGLYTDSFVSALGLNPSMGGGGGGGATALSELSDVQLSGLLTGDVLIYDGTHWANRPQSSIVPDLSEYATRTWVQQQGYATSAALSGYATQSWVQGLGYITAATAEATFATKLGISGTKIGTYVNGILGNLITVPYAANADTVDGLHSTNLAQSFGGGTIDANDTAAFPYIYGGKLFDATNAPYDYSAFLHFGHPSYFAQFNAYDNHLMFRASGETNKAPEWKEVAFIDSNVASATKLQTARTLWGQSFDGTSNVVNPAKMGYIIFTAVDGSNAGYIGRPMPSTDDIYITSYTNKNIIFHTKGNVGVGAEAVAPAYKLDVAGAIRIQNRLYFGDSAHYIEVDGDGYFHFSHGVYTDGFLSAKGLNSSGGGGEGGASYDRLDAWGDYTADKAGWVLSAGLGYDLHRRVRSLEGGSALSFTTEGTGNVVTAVKKSGTSVIVTKGLTALTSHQPIYALNFQAGAFEAKKYTPNTGTQTVNIPTKTSHLSNDSGFITSSALTGYATQSWVQGLGYITASALTPYITEATANATFATKLGVSGNQIGTYVNGILGNLISVPYADESNTTRQLEAFADDTFTNGQHYIKAIRDASGWTTRLWMCYKNGAKQANAVWVYGADVAQKLQDAHTIWGQAFDGAGPVFGDMKDVGDISMAGQISSTYVHPLRMVYGNYGAFFRQDGDSLYLMLTNANDQYGSYNNLRPLQVSLGTGDVSLCSTMYVKHSEGNVGIGISTPSYKLDVAGDIHSSEYIRADKAVLAPFLRGNTSTGAFIGDAAEGLGEGYTGLLLYSYGYTPIHLATNGYVRAIITAGGNFGIGNPTPAYKLDVAGAVHATTGFITETDVRLNNRIYFKGTDHYIEVDANGLFHFSHGVYTDGTLAARGFNNSGSTISLWGNTYDGKNSIDGVIRSIYAADPTEGTIIGKFLAKKSDPLGLILRTYTNGAVSLQSQRENDNLKRFVLALNPLGGNVAINQTSASYTLDVAGTIKASVNIIATGTVTAKDFIKPSDARLKTYMEDVTLSVADVANAPAWRYKWKSDESVDVGSTTQYWGAIVPELIHKLPDGKYFGLDYGKAALLSVITVARTVQSHEERIAELERENEQLKQTLKKYIS